MKYDILLFDADQTLLDFKKGEHDAIKEVFIAVGIPSDDATVEEYSQINDSLWKKLERGEIEKARLLVERFEILCDRHGYIADAGKMAELYIDTLSTKSYLLGNALDICCRLAEKCRMYIITNGVKKVQDGRFNSSPIKECFDGIFISEEIGFEKPRTEFFDAVMSSIPDFDKKRALVIGDSLTSDIKGGINAGIDTCWFNPSGKTAPADMNINYVISDLAEVEKIIE